MAKKVNRAGVIPYIIENNKIKMMFMLPSDPKYGTNFFQIAKGKQEKDETLEEAALREAGEEIGLFEGNIKELYDLGTFMGRTSIYIAKIKDKKLFGDPSFETAEVKWMTAEEFDEIGRKLHKPIVKAAHRLIQDKEDLT